MVAVAAKDKRSPIYPTGAPPGSGRAIAGHKPWSPQVLVSLQAFAGPTRSMQWGELTRPLQGGAAWVGGGGIDRTLYRKEGLLLPSRACALLWTCRCLSSSMSQCGRRMRYANVRLCERGRCARNNADGNYTPCRNPFQR
jgi:hypothetical protein